MSTDAKRIRTRKAPEVRRQELLDAALSVFAEKGIAESKVEDITAAAGVAKGTFYLYFESKEHVVAALLDRFVQERLEAAAELAARVGREDWWGLVDATVESAIDFMLERRAAIQIFWQESASPETRETFATCGQRLNDLFVWGIQQGVDAGAFHVSDSQMVATFLHHAIDGAVLQAILYSQEPDRERLVRTAKELARKILAG